MPPFSRTECIIMTVVPMTTGAISTISSATIIAMVFLSRKKLGDPYRRIIFGMSVFDIFLSLAFVFKIFKTTPEQPNAWIALGNQTSCNALGFIHFAGLNGALVYNLSLNVYYLCLIKYNMRAKFYCNRIEPFIHGLPILWGILSASIIVGTGHMNPAYAGDCLIAPYPVNCLDKPGVECIRGMHVHAFRAIFSTMPRLIVLALIIFTTGMIWWSVRSTEKKMDKFRISMVSQRMASGASTRRRSSVAGSLREVTARLMKDTPSTRRMSLRRGRSKARSFLVQAQWYVLAFLLTHALPITITIMRKFSITPSFWLYLFARFLSPLQGLFNIVVYTRPHVTNQRKRKPSLTWWGAFKKVVASGGDDDADRTNRLRGANTRRSLSSPSSRGSLRFSLGSKTRSMITRLSFLMHPTKTTKDDKVDDGDESSKSISSHPSQPLNSSVAPRVHEEIIEEHKKRRVSFKITTNKTPARSSGLLTSNKDEETPVIEETATPDIAEENFESLMDYDNNNYPEADNDTMMSEPFP